MNFQDLMGPLPRDESGAKAIVKRLQRECVMEKVQAMYVNGHPSIQAVIASAKPSKIKKTISAIERLLPNTPTTKFIPLESKEHHCNFSVSLALVWSESCANFVFTGVAIYCDTRRRHLHFDSVSFNIGTFSISPHALQRLIQDLPNNSLPNVVDVMFAGTMCGVAVSISENERMSRILDIDTPVASDYEGWKYIIPIPDGVMYAVKTVVDDEAQIHNCITTFVASSRLTDTQKQLQSDCQPMTSRCLVFMVTSAIQSAEDHLSAAPSIISSALQRIKDTEHSNIDVRMMLKYTRFHIDQYHKDRFHAVD